MKNEKVAKGRIIGLAGPCCKLLRSEVLQKHPKITLVDELIRPSVNVNNVYEIPRTRPWPIGHLCQTQSFFAVNSSTRRSKMEANLISEAKLSKRWTKWKSLTGKTPGFTKIGIYDWSERSDRIRRRSTARQIGIISYPNLSISEFCNLYGLFHFWTTNRRHGIGRPAVCQ